jgi:hypothetical protein
MGVGEVTRDVASVVTVWAALATALLLVGCAGATRWARRTGRTDRPAALVFAGLAAVAAVLGLTLFRDGIPHAVVPGGIAWSADGWSRLSTDPLGSTQIALNAALFAPAGFLWTLLTGRPWRVLAALAGLSLGLETLQGLIGVGAPDVADLAANTVGAALGAGAASVWEWIRPGPAVGGRRAGKQVARAAALTTALVVAAVVAVNVGAAHRQRSVEQELAARFAGTDLGQFAEWEQQDRLHEEVFAAISVFSDAAVYRGDSVAVRYPASFFGLRRCAFVEWHPATVEIRPGSGRACA